MKEARQQYERMVSLDPDIARGNPSDYSRLLRSLDLGYFYAYPKELKLYDNRKKLAILLADTSQFDRDGAVQ